MDKARAAARQAKALEQLAEKQATMHAQLAASTPATAAQVDDLAARLERIEMLLTAKGKV